MLCIQDTTEADGLGPLNYEARRGMYVYPTYAVRRQGATRARALDSRLRTRRRDGRYMAATRLVYVADREPDLVALMRRARDLNTAVDSLVYLSRSTKTDEGITEWMIPEAAVLSHIPADANQDHVDWKAHPFEVVHVESSCVRASQST